MSWVSAELTRARGAAGFGSYGARLYEEGRAEAARRQALVGHSRPAHVGGPQGARM